MPETVVKTPTGKEIKVTHPKGATQEEIISYAKQNYEPLNVYDPIEQKDIEINKKAPEWQNAKFFDDPVTKKKVVLRENSNPLKNLAGKALSGLVGFGQGLTFDNQDEMTGALGALTKGGVQGVSMDGYTDKRDIFRKLDALSQTNPVTYNTSKLIGNLVNPLSKSTEAGKFANVVKDIGLGAVQGFGSSDKEGADLSKDVANTALLSGAVSGFTNFAKPAYNAVAGTKYGKHLDNFLTSAGNKIKTLPRKAGEILTNTPKNIMDEIFNNQGLRNPVPLKTSIEQIPGIHDTINKKLSRTMEELYPLRKPEFEPSRLSDIYNKTKSMVTNTEKIKTPSQMQSSIVDQFGKPNILDVVNETTKTTGKNIGNNLAPDVLRAINTARQPLESAGAFSKKPIPLDEILNLKTALAAKIPFGEQSKNAKTFINKKIGAGVTDMANEGIDPVSLWQKGKDPDLLTNSRRLAELKARLAKHLPLSQTPDDITGLASGNVLPDDKAVNMLSKYKESPARTKFGKDIQEFTGINPIQDSKNRALTDAINNPKGMSFTDYAVPGVAAGALGLSQGFNASDPLVAGGGLFGALLVRNKFGNRIARGSVHAGQDVKSFMSTPQMKNLFDNAVQKALSDPRKATVPITNLIKDNITKDEFIENQTNEKFREKKK